MKMPVRAFTLIELLIVVAIIGILAAIAVPNFLNARTRALVARTYGDMKAVRDAFQMYRLDNGDWVPDYDGIGAASGSEFRTYVALTTPVAYMSSIPLDVWVRNDEFRLIQGKSVAYYEYWGYKSGGVARLEACNRYGLGYAMRSIGPDHALQWNSDFDALGRGERSFAYSSSNGLTSLGDILATNLGVME
ncbi:MAG: prepilin-type N-terminal cleavage/methylation domain-containing protein [bacterium]